MEAIGILVGAALAVFVIIVVVFVGLGFIRATAKIIGGLARRGARILGRPDDTTCGYAGLGEEHPISGLREFIECGRRLKPDEVHRVADLSDPMDEHKRGEGSAVYVDYCGQHCPGDCVNQSHLAKGS